MILSEINYSGNGYENVSEKKVKKEKLLLVFSTWFWSTGNIESLQITIFKIRLANMYLSRSLHRPTIEIGYCHKKIRYSIYLFKIICIYYPYENIVRRLFESRFSYGIVGWGGVNSSYLKSLKFYWRSSLKKYVRLTSQTTFYLRER